MSFGDFFADLPDVEEGFSYGTRAFKVKKKLLARIHQKEDALVVKTDFDEREKLMQANPVTYYITDPYTNHPLEYSLDDSTFEDLFKSKDPHFYDGIPEYQMLKRGMNHEEKIDNGYWFGYKMAEALEKQLKNK